MIAASLASATGSMLTGQTTRKFSILWLLYQAMQIMVFGTLSAFGMVIGAYYSGDGLRCAPQVGADLRTGLPSRDCVNNVGGWPRNFAENGCAYYSPWEMAPTFRNVQPYGNRPLVLNTLLYTTGLVSAYELILLIVAVVSVQAVRDSVGVGWSSVQDMMTSAERASAIVEGKENEAAVKRIIQRAGQLKLLMSALPYPMRLKNMQNKSNQRYRFVIDSNLQAAPSLFHRILLLPYHNVGIRVVVFFLLVVAPVIALFAYFGSIDPLYLWVNEEFACSFRTDLRDQTQLGPYPLGANQTLLACDWLLFCSLREFATSWIVYSTLIVLILGSICRIMYFLSMWWGSGLVLPFRKRPGDRMIVLNEDFPLWRQYFEAFDDNSEVRRNITYAIGILSSLNASDVAARNSGSPNKVNAWQLREEIANRLQDHTTGVRNPELWSRRSRVRRPRHNVTSMDPVKTSAPLNVDDVEQGDEDVCSAIPAFEEVFAASQVRGKAVLWLMLRIWHFASFPTEKMAEEEAARVTRRLRTDFDKFADILDHWPCVLWGEDAIDSMFRLRLNGLLNGWRTLVRHYQRMADTHEMDTILADCWLQYLSGQSQVDYVDALRWLAKRIELVHALDPQKLRHILSERFGRQFDNAPVKAVTDVRGLILLCNMNPDWSFVATPTIRRQARLLIVQLYTEGGVSPPLIVAGYGTDTDDLILLQTSLMGSHPLNPDIRSQVCTMVDLETMMSGRGWDGVKGVSGLHLAWPQYIAIELGEAPSNATWENLLRRAVNMRGYNGFAIVATLCANRSMEDDDDTDKLRVITWNVLMDLLLSDVDTHSNDPSEAWLLEIIKLMLSILFSRQELNAGDRWQLSSRFLRSGFSLDFRAALVKLYIEKANALWFIESDENVLHLVTRFIHPNEMALWLREALISGATQRVNSTSFDMVRQRQRFGTIALVELCKMFLIRPQGHDELKEAIAVLLDAGADSNMMDPRGDSAIKLATGQSGEFDEKAMAPKRRTSKQGPSLHEKRARLKSILTHHRRTREGLGGNTVGSMSTLRGWREEVVHHVLDGAGPAYVGLNIDDI